MLKISNEIRDLSKELYDQQSLLVMGRGYNYATCLEGALVSSNLSERMTHTSVQINEIILTFILLFLYNPLTTILKEETFLQEFLVILKQALQNYWKILKKYVFGSTSAVMLSVGLNLQAHTSVYPEKRQNMGHNGNYFDRVQLYNIELPFIHIM